MKKSKPEGDPLDKIIGIPVIFVIILTIALAVYFFSNEYVRALFFLVITGAELE